MNRFTAAYKVLTNRHVRVIDADGFPVEFTAGLGFPNDLTTSQMLDDSMVVASRGYIARAFSEPPLGLYNETKEEFVPFPPLKKLMANANVNNYSSRNFRAATGADIGVLGNSYWRPRSNKTIEILPAAQVTVERHEKNVNLITGYTYDDKKYSPNEIFHIRGLPNPKDPAMGLNLLKCLKNLIILDERATAYLNLSLEKLGLLGVFVSPNFEKPSRGNARVPHVKINEKGRKQDDAEAGEERYNSSLASLQKGYGVYWPGDADINKIAPPPREMQALDIFRRTESRLAAVLAVSAKLMEFEFSAEASTFNNIAIARRWVAETLLLYLWEIVEEQLTWFFLYNPQSPILSDTLDIEKDKDEFSLKFDLKKVPALQESKFQETDWVLELVKERVISREAAAQMLKLPFTGDNEDPPESREEDRGENTPRARARARVPSESAGG